MANSVSSVEPVAEAVEFLRKGQADGTPLKGIFVRDLGRAHPAYSYR